jgi:ABC-type long-subunit fatty acid transport system fused permease/ATPase subunit
MVQSDFFKDIFLLSGTIWMLVAILTHFSVMRFIVPRYEKETGLIDTVAFKEVTPFARHLPSLWSSIVYISHLVNFLWFWKWVNHLKIYRDIDDAKQVTGNFTRKEIWLVHLDLASMIISVVHLSTYPYIFK